MSEGCCENSIISDESKNCGVMIVIQLDNNATKR